MFCVYSGDGVAQLRAFLRLLHSEHSDSSDANGADVSTEALIQHHQHAPIQYPFVVPTAPFHPTNAPNMGQGNSNLHPPPPMNIAPPLLTGQALVQHVGAANRPPPPPPPHGHYPQHGVHQPPPQGVVPVAEDDEDVDEDMRVGED